MTIPTSMCWAVLGGSALGNFLWGCVIVDDWKTAADRTFFQAVVIVSLIVATWLTERKAKPS